jgi:hypothetical protein
MARWPTTPSAYKYPQAPWLIHPILSSSPLRSSSHIWSRARELEETPHAGRHRAAGFPIRVLLLPLLRWTGARTMSIHRMRVILRRRCTCGACLRQAVQLQDLEVGFVGLHRQRLCGNVIPLSVFKGMNTTATPLPYNYVVRSWGNGL